MSFSLTPILTSVGVRLKGNVMANRRMFSQRITGDEKFLEMPTSAQNLYFHLGIYADDDGFVNPQKIVRMIGANPDDLKVLLAKGFVIPFETGVIVITHWKENNYIQADRYTPTIYQDEYKKLECIQNVYSLDTQVRLGKSKVRLGKDISDKSRKKPLHNPLGVEIIKAFEEVDAKNKTYYGNKTQRLACDFLLGEFSLEEILARIKILSQTNKFPYFPKINSPYDLKEKWVKLEDQIKSKQLEIKNKERSIIL